MMIKVLIDKFLNKRKPEASENTQEPVRDFIKQICKKIDADKYEKVYELCDFRLKIKDEPLVIVWADYSNFFLNDRFVSLSVNEDSVSITEAEKELLFVSLHCAHLREENANRLTKKQRIEEALASIKEW